MSWTAPAAAVKMQGIYTCPHTQNRIRTHTCPRAHTHALAHTQKANSLNDSNNNNNNNNKNNKKRGGVFLDSEPSAAVKIGKVLLL